MKLNILDKTIYTAFNYLDIYTPYLHKGKLYLKTGWLITYNFETQHSENVTTADMEVAPCNIINITVRPRG